MALFGLSLFEKLSLSINIGPVNLNLKNKKTAVSIGNLLVYGGIVGLLFSAALKFGELVVLFWMCLILAGPILFKTDLPVAR